jgi:hypothetical protein
MTSSLKSRPTRIARVLSAAACAVLALAVAASPAGAYKPTLRVTLPKKAIVWSLAVDRFGDMFLGEDKFISNIAFDASFPTKIVRLNPQGKFVGAIGGGDGSNLMGGDVAVTPDGQTAYIGGVQKELDGTNDGGYVMKYEVANGWALKGTDPGSDNDFVAPLTVDPTGQHIYAAASPMTDSVVPGNRIFELDATTLKTIRVFALSGSALLTSQQVNQITVGGPDDDVYVDLDATTNDGTSFVQVYQPDGVFIRQFAVADASGVAVNAKGDVFTGSKHGLVMHRPDGSVAGTGIGTTDPIEVSAIDPAGDLFGWDKGRIVKFAPDIPQTKIVDDPGPGLTELYTSPTVTFKFKSSADNSTFECRIRRHGYDQAPFAPCPAKQTFHNLPNDTYALQVRAISPDDMADPTPASLRFKVATAYAHAKITSHPAKLIGETTATFAFTADAPGATFKCRLTPLFQTPGAFKACSSPKSYSGLAHGVYSFQVVGVTSAGIAEPGGDSFQFAVDPKGPKVTVPVPALVVGQQVDPSGVPTVEWTWSASDPNTPAAQLIDTLQGTYGPIGGPFPPYVTVQGADHVPGQTSVTLPLPLGAAFEFRAEATNALGVTSTGKATGGVQAKVIDDGDPAIHYSSGWSQGLTGTGAIGGKAAKATQPGATATLHFTGMALGVIAVPAPGRGVMEVCVDQRPCGPVDTNASVKTERSLVYAADGLGDGQHTITITAKTAPVVLDAFTVVSH